MDQKIILNVGGGVMIAHSRCRRLNVLPCWMHSQKSRCPNIVVWHILTMEIHAEDSECHSADVCCVRILRLCPGGVRQPFLQPSPSELHQAPNSQLIQERQLTARTCKLLQDSLIQYHRFRPAPQPAHDVERIFMFFGQRRTVATAVCDCHHVASQQPLTGRPSLILFSQAPLHLPPLCHTGSMVCESCSNLKTKLPQFGYNQ